MPEVTLNLPGRDQKIEEYKQYLRNLGQAPASTTPPTPTWATASGAAAARPRAAARRRGRSTWPDQPKGYWIDKTFEGPLTARPRASPRTRSGRTTPTSSSRWRRSPRSSASASASIPTIRRCRRTGRRAALHLLQLRRLQARAGDRQQPQRRHVPVLSAAGWKAASTMGKDPDRDDPLLRRPGQAVEDPLPQRQRSPCRTSSRPSSTTATWTCTR